MYADTTEPFDTTEFGKRLWGNVYYNQETRTFDSKPSESGQKRSFIEFILEPLYKIFSHTIEQDADLLKTALSKLSIRLKPNMYDLDVKPQLKAVFAHFFESITGFTDMCAEFLPSPVDIAATKVEHLWTGPMDSATAKAMQTCDSSGPLMIHVAKLFNFESAANFYAFGRIFSGSVAAGQTVRVLGEKYTTSDEEDMMTCQVSSVSIFESRYRVGVTVLRAGSWVLLGGVDTSIVKTATITDESASTRRTFSDR